jgi:hypothetical protein
MRAYQPKSLSNGFETLGSPVFLHIFRSEPMRPISTEERTATPIATAIHLSA